MKNMGLFNKFINQTRKPEGMLGNLMLNSMNKGHAKLADWGFSNLQQINVDQAVDLGCGAGRNVGELLKKYPKVTGVDYSEASVKKSREYNQKAIREGRCEIMRGNVSALELPSETYDLATAFETVYFWPGLDQCFTNVAGILKPGGLFMIVNESDGLDETGKKYETMIDGMKIYKAEELEESLRKAGFREVKSYHHPDKPWITITARK